MEKIIIFGTGNIAELAHFYFKNDSPYEVIAFTANKEFINVDEYQKLPLVEFENIDNIYSPDHYSMFVALSYKGVNKNRAEKYYEAKNKGYKLINYISSKITCWGDTEVGDNCFIFEDQTIQPFVKIGNNVTMWSGNHIGHNSIIGDHCFITSHCVISGHVVIEPKCFIGVNATIRDGIKIAKECVVGAGAIIVKDTIEKGVYTCEGAKLRSMQGEKLNYFKETNYKKRNSN